MGGCGYGVWTRRGRAGASRRHRIGRARRAPPHPRPAQPGHAPSAPPRLNRRVPCRLFPAPLLAASHLRPTADFPRRSLCSPLLSIGRPGGSAAASYPGAARGVPGVQGVPGQPGWAWPGFKHCRTDNTVDPVPLQATPCSPQAAPPTRLPIPERQSCMLRLEMPGSDPGFQ